MNPITAERICTLMFNGASMKIKITDEMGNNDDIEMSVERISVKDVLKELDIDPFEAIVMGKGEIILESEILTNDDEIKIINVIHGG